MLLKQRAHVSGAHVCVSAHKWVCVCVWVKLNWHWITPRSILWPLKGWKQNQVFTLLWMTAWRQHQRLGEGVPNTVQWSFCLLAVGRWVVRQPEAKDQPGESPGKRAPATQQEMPRMFWQEHAAAHPWVKTPNNFQKGLSEAVLGTQIKLGRIHHLNRWSRKENDYPWNLSRALRRGLPK